MADPFVAEIRIFPFTFAPSGWAFCNGQLLPISQNTALFSLLGTTYGGNGQSTFALPDLQGRAVMQPDQGPGLSDHFLGELAGQETVTLLPSEIPAHTHAVSSTTSPGTDNDPSSDTVVARPIGAAAFTTQTAPAVAMAQVGPAGSGLPHNNMMPYLTLNFCIALQGVFPPRT